MEPLRDSGSEGSEGSARFQQAGSKGVVSPDGDEYEVSVTGFPLVSPVLHNGEPEPPSTGRNPAEDF